MITSLAFAAAGRRVGSSIVNTTRLILAVIMLLIVHACLLGSWWPPIDAVSLSWLAASGIIGLGIGDQLCFQALVDVGSRITTLLLTLAPPITALLAWPVLDEALGIIAVLGMTVTLMGLAWVVGENRSESPSESGGEDIRPHPRRGIVFAALAGVAQAMGLILAKLGLGDDDALDPWSATLVRLVFGTATALLLLAVIRFWRTSSPRRSMDLRRWPRTAVLILVGAVFGPVLGVWLSLVGIDHVEAGIAATLMSLSPLFILPFSARIEGDRITRRAVLGTILSVVGIAILAYGMSKQADADLAESTAPAQASSTSVEPGSTS